MTARPRVSFTGDTVVLQCRTNGSASMSWNQGSTRTVSVASTLRRVLPGYSRISLNDSTEGQFDLVIKSTQQHDAGLYTCLAGSDDVAKAELTLLGKCFV